MLRRTRRAPNACSWCHHRKVRCDASILGSPCTRCRQDGRRSCTLRSKATKQYKTPDHPEVPTTREGQSEVIFSPLDDQSFPAPTRRRQPSIETQHDDFNRFSYTSPSQCSNFSHKEYNFIDIDQLLSLSPENTAILDCKGCLSLPDQNAMDEFVQHYFRRIHPLVPVLDEAEFWRSYVNPGTGRKVSLFVFQSMLFASCPLVCLTTLRRCGFRSRRDARKKLYNRAKLLFEMAAEKTCHANAQGAVLLSHYTSAEVPRAGSLWLTRAIENTIRINARPSLRPENVDESLKKRLWWSILLRDRSICIGLRRRPQITSSAFFGSKDLPKTEDFEEEMQNSRVYDYGTKQSLFMAFRQQCELAALLTDLSSLVFDTSQTRKPSLSFIDFQNLMSTIRTIKQSLSTWEESVHSAIPQSLTPESDDATATLIYLTVMYYHAARVDLAQYAALVLEENQFYAKDIYTNWIQDISNDLSEAIAGLTIVMEYFSVNNDADSLPLSVLGYVGMPLVLAAIDLKLSPSREALKLRQKRLESVGLIIRHSETLYDVTDCVAVGANHILHLAYITTQNLFSGGESSQRLCNIAKIKDPSPHNLSSLMFKSALAQQPQSWQEAFVRCPRAYLLISTSMDYSLSLGRLPSAHDLPRAVRDLPVIGAIARLPWTVELCPSISVKTSVDEKNSPNHFSEMRSISVEATRASKASPTVGESEPGRKQNIIHNHCILFQRDSPTRAANLPESYVELPTQRESPEMNLDYMEFGNLPSFSGAPDKDHFPKMELSSPELQHAGVLSWSGGGVQAASYELSPHPSIGAVGLSVFDTFFHEAFEGNWASW